MLHSIKTKNYIAEFYYSDRKDAFDVSESGVQGNKTLKKLDRIELYTLCDREQNGPNATALKKVHFVYDYSLCKNIPSNKLGTLTDNELDNQRGKLTLKKIYFTYEDSEKGQLSPYIFHYADADHNLAEDACPNPAVDCLNPDYDFRGNCRWGNYKPNNGTLANSEEPYVEQDETKANKRSAAWSMRTIQLPSGGVIEIDLEADDYAYVQDKRATRMFKVLGFGEFHDSAPIPYLYGGAGAFGTMNNNFMFVQAPLATDAASFKKLYLGTGKYEIKQVFFKFFVDLTGKGDYEYVPGYADV